MFASDKSDRTCKCFSTKNCKEKCSRQVCVVESIIDEFWFRACFSILSHVTMNLFGEWIHFILPFLFRSSTSICRHFLRFRFIRVDMSREECRLLLSFIFTKTKRCYVLSMLLRNIFSHFRFCLFDCNCFFLSKI